MASSTLQGVGRARSTTRHRPHGRARLAFLVPALLLVGVTACQPAPPTSRPPTATARLWASRAEILALPASGPAWAHLVATARGSWGTPSLADNNAQHDTATLAGALVAVRTKDAALTAKTRAAIMAVTRTRSFRRVLELSRNLTSYVIAADLVGLAPADESRFRSFLSAVRTRPLEGHSGGTDLLSTALRSPNNWGAMARAAMTSVDLYLGDRKQLAQVAAAHRAWLGEPVANQLRYTDTRWHAAGRPVGINRRGSTVLGLDVDGVLPEDQRRTGDPKAGAAVAEGSYPWEALQGAVVTGVLLDRAGVVDINAGDRALVRAFDWLIHENANPPSGDDLWLPWLINDVAGPRFPTQLTRSPGKNMAWTDWTSGPGSR